MKKIISSILALTFILTTTISALGADPTAEQLADLKKYNIFSGDADGNLRLEDSITRAEAAKMICTILCYPADAKESSFPDVAPGHWAVGYIETAKNAGIVSGDESGNFRPSDPVTNEEYLKMIVSALGFNPMAEARGGYPAGYVTIAHTYGLTKDMQFEVGVPAKRGDVAVITHRAIDMPIMQQTGFGSQVEYSVMDGKNNTDLLTLRLLGLDPDYKYPVSEETENEESSPDFSKSAYSYADIEIEGLAKKGATYTFTDKKNSKSLTYTVDGSTYVHSAKNTLPLSEIKEGMVVRVLCAKIDNETVKVLGIEIFAD